MFFTPPNKYEQFCFVEWIFSCLKPNEFGSQNTDVVIQIFALFHLRPMWLFYRKYWSEHHNNEIFEIEYEHVFTEKQISLLYGSIPSDCMFVHSHPVEPLLLDYFLSSYAKATHNGSLDLYDFWRLIVLRNKYRK